MAFSILGLPLMLPVGGALINLEPTIITIRLDVKP